MNVKQSEAEKNKISRTDISTFNAYSAPHIHLRLNLPTIHSAICVAKLCSTFSTSYTWHVPKSIEVNQPNFYTTT